MTITQIPQWTLGDRIRKAREVAGLEQQDLADALYMSRAAVSSWENSHSQPAPRKLAVIASVTGVSASWLLTGTADTEADTGRNSDQLILALAA
jgi:transcriptional regulator with XRE-family HTH domain